MEDNFNFTQIKNLDSDSFYMDEDIAKVFFNEIIVAAALKDEKKFEQLIELDLPWFHSFSIEKSYEVKQSHNGYELDDQTEYFSTFIHQAAYVFSDEYCLRLLEHLLVLDNNSEKVVPELRDYVDYNRNKLMEYSNPYYLVKLLLMKDNVESLKYLQKMEVIDDTIICETIFLKSYTQLEKYAHFILENNVKMTEFFLGTSDGKKVGKINELVNNMMNKYVHEDQLHSIIPFFNKIMTDYPEYKKQIFEAFSPLLFISKLNGQDRMHMLTQFVLNNLLSIHDLYSYDTQRIVKKGENTTDTVSVKDALRLPITFLNQLTLLQKEKLEVELDKETQYIPKRKL